MTRQSRSGKKKARPATEIISQCPHARAWSNLRPCAPVLCAQRVPRVHRARASQLCGQRTCRAGARASHCCFRSAMASAICQMLSSSEDDSDADDDHGAGEDLRLGVSLLEIIAVGIDEAPRGNHSQPHPDLVVRSTEYASRVRLPPPHTTHSLTLTHAHAHARARAHAHTLKHTRRADA